MSRTARIAFSSFLVALVATVFAAPSSAIQKGQPLVPSEYFGTQVPFSIFGTDRPSVKKFNKVFHDIKRTRFDSVRVIFSWGEQEPNRPVNGKHTYNWKNFDRYVKISASHGVRPLAVLGFSPFWARVSNTQCGAGISGIEPTTRNLDDWQKAVKAFVKRYGRGGRFWQLNPDVRKRPIKVFEIWNEPTVRPFWCPGADPRKYADLLLRATKAIHRVDRKAMVVTGGVPEGENFTVGSGSMPARQFFKKVFQRKPILKRKVDAIGIHPYEFLQKISFYYGAIANFRKSLQRAGVPNRMPMYITETGWPQGKKRWGYSQKKRIRSYKHAISSIPRSNCNVIGVSFFSWLTIRNPANVLSYLNLAKFPGLKPLPIVKKIRRAIGIERGLGRKPNVEERKDCKRMPRLDRDRDGLPDERDPKPLVPR